MRYIELRDAFEAGEHYLDFASGRQQAVEVAIPLVALNTIQASSDQKANGRDNEPGTELHDDLNQRDAPPVVSVGVG